MKGKGGRGGECPTAKRKLSHSSGERKTKNVREKDMGGEKNQRGRRGEKGKGVEI